MGSNILKMDQNMVQFGLGFETPKETQIELHSYIYDLENIKNIQKK